MGGENHGSSLPFRHACEARFAGRRLMRRDCRLTGFSDRGGPIFRGQEASPDNAQGSIGSQIDEHRHNRSGVGPLDGVFFGFRGYLEPEFLTDEPVQCLGLA